MVSIEDLSFSKFLQLCKESKILKILIKSKLLLFEDFEKSGKLSA
jgi:hypothetical protein